MSGNEAIARGAYEAGCKTGTGYPGTPSTEILENFKNYPNNYVEWSINEKVALEVAIGSSLAGSRTLVTMKHVGVNVAADPLFTLSYIGVKGGLVIVEADDPDMHSSQNEQDNRYYARAAKIPMLEPSDSEESKAFCKIAFELSEIYDTPILLRTVTRIAHTKSLVTIEENISGGNVKPGFQKNIQKYVMIPAFARKRHLEVEKRLLKLKQVSEDTLINHSDIKSLQLGFVVTGINYQYVKEVFPDASILKLGMTYPLPEEMIKLFCSKIKKVYIVEDLDPIMETEIKSWGITNVTGKDIFPITGELSPNIIFNAVNNIDNKVKELNTPLIPPRPPSLCPGCPHHSVFMTLNKLGVVVSGDIGCYTLGVLPPFSAMDTCIDMGASIGVAQGLEIAGQKSVAVIGDSTFAHSGITSLINAVYNKRNILTIVLDNGTTAMTGMQPNPFSGKTIKDEDTYQVNYQMLGEAIGIDKENIVVVDAYKNEDIENTISNLMKKEKISLMIVKSTCIILKKRKVKKGFSGG